MKRYVYICVVNLKPYIYLINKSFYHFRMTKTKSVHLLYSPTINTNSLINIFSPIVQMKYSLKINKVLLKKKTKLLISP